MAETTHEPIRGLTFDDVWAALMEDRERMEKSQLQYEESRRDFDRRMEESNRDFDRRMKESERRLEREFAKTSRIVRENGRQIGGLHRSFGELAEHLVAPGIADRFNELGFHFDGIASGGFKILDENRKVKTEIDILLENSDYIIAVEVKTKPAEHDIEHHINRLGILRENRNKHKDGRKILGAIAGAVFPNDVKQAVLESGLYVLEQSGDTIKLELTGDFVPREW